MPDESDQDRIRESRENRARQAKAWSIALDPVYGMMGMGLIGYGIDYLASTGFRWTIILAITGLVVGFYRFIREALDLNQEQSKSSPRTDGDPDT
jgi:F0F1-type ATP synthase assembly protein I